MDLLAKIAPQVGVGLVAAGQAIQRRTELGRRLQVSLLLADAPHAWPRLFVNRPCQR